MLYAFMVVVPVAPVCSIWSLTPALVQVMLTTLGCQVNLHECVTLLRYVSGGQPLVVSASAVAALLHLPDAQDTVQRSTSMRPQSTRPRAGDLKCQLATVCMLPTC